MWLYVIGYVVTAAVVYHHEWCQSPGSSFSWWFFAVFGGLITAVIWPVVAVLYLLYKAVG